MTKRILSLILALILMLSCGVLSGAAEKANVGGEITTTTQEEKTNPSKISISGSHYVGIGKKITLKASVSPSKASQKVTWKSSNKKIAKVDKYGKVTGVKAGKVTITAVSKAKKSVKKTWTITVKKAITKIQITAPKKTINLSNSKVLQLKAKVSPSTASRQAVSWKSSNKSIATVGSSGKVIGKKPGTVTITATATDGSGKKASIKIKVVKKTTSKKPVYRALLIGERNFLRYSYSSWSYYKDDTPRNENDAKNMAAMLGKVYGPEGTKYKVTRKTDLSFNGIHNAIKSTFSGTKDSDVSLFFIATHGNSSGDGELEMAFAGDPGDYDDRSKHYDHELLPFSTLATWLKKYVKGKVIVVIQSCGAGSCIYDPKEQNGGGATEPHYQELTGADQEAALKKIASNAVRAFEKADPGILDENSTGDLRTSKFYVLAASRHMEESWGWLGDDGYNMFTQWLIDGVGRVGNSPADKGGNGDGMVNLTELFKYIKKVGDSYPIPHGGEYYYQHVQRYPVGSTYKLFKVK